MTNEEIERELGHLATKEALADLRAELHKDFGNFKADLIKTIWTTQLSMAGLIIALVGIINGTTFFLLTQSLHK